MAKKKTQALNKDIPAFWVWGNRFQCQKFWQMVIDTLGNPTVEILDCGYKPANAPKNYGVSTSSDIVMLLKHQDPFSDRPRVLKLKGLPEDYVLLTDYLDLVNDYNVLFIDSPPGYRQKPPGNRFVPATASNFYKAIKASGTMIEYELEARTVDQAVGWIRGVAEELGIKLDPDAADLMVKHRGKNLDILHSELVKLADFHGKGMISPDDVQACCPASFQRQVWDLIDDLDFQNYDSAISHLQQLFAVMESGPPSGFYGDVMMLLGALKQHFMFMLLVRNHCDQLTYQGVMEAIGGLKKRQRKEGVDYWENDLFSSQFIRMTIDKLGVQAAMQWKASKFYLIWEDLGVCSHICRENSSNHALIKVCLSSFIMLACSRITSEQSKQMRGLYVDMYPS